MEDPTELVTTEAALDALDAIVMRFDMGTPKPSEAELKMAIQALAFVLAATLRAMANVDVTS